CWFPWC
uniref:Contryphan Co838/Co854 n=1 Tax=Conus coronatus TaxID=89441 RepID=COW_CONCS|nr:RecName: Full=Contryphan Co838/Co854 [Conus coronatus]